MKAQDILGSPPFVLLGVAIARTMPRRAGYWLARQVARIMARRRNQFFCTIRANLRHVVGPGASAPELDDLAERAIGHAGRTYFDMFRTTLQDVRQGQVPLRVDPAEWDSGRRAFADERGVILVGPHMSNFDLAMQWFESQGVGMQVLGLADPNAGTQMLNWLRRRRGVEVTPIGLTSLRQAVTRLRQGGVVTTGVDRPVSVEDEPVPFFDAPARLPTGHIRLALRTGALIMVTACLQHPDASYSVRIMPALEMEVSGNRERDVRHNARRVLAVIEGLVRQAPEQWLMFVPVWPEDV